MLGFGPITAAWVFLQQAAVYANKNSLSAIEGKLGPGSWYYRLPTWCKGQGSHLCWWGGSIAVVASLALGVMGLFGFDKSIVFAIKIYSSASSSMAVFIEKYRWGIASTAFIAFFFWIRSELSAIKEVSQLSKPSNSDHQHLSSIIKRMHNSVHKVRNIWHGYFRDLDKLRKKGSIEDGGFDDLSSNWNRQVWDTVTAQVRYCIIEFLSLRGMSGYENDMRVTIKIISSGADIARRAKRENRRMNRSWEDIESGSSWVVTVYRDSATFQKEREPEIFQGVYSISSENTAFDKIFNKRERRQNERCSVTCCPSCKSGSCHFQPRSSTYCPIFASDDLKKLSGYRNENKNWKNEYNSTAIVPIRVYHGNMESPIFYGALAVDSMNPSGNPIFTGETIFNILAHGADLIALSMQAMEGVERHVMQSETGGVNVAA
ncbi:MAG: hypothetical protein H7831_04770 [Magnetococcus sp. WYHC-3]